MTELWHCRLGHLNQNYIDQLAKKNLATGINYKNNSCVINKCEPCILGKMQRLSILKKSKTKSTEALQLVHTDLCGTISWW